MKRWAAAGGIAGPAAFVTAWASLGAITDGYSPVDDPISRLAAAGVSTQPLMTAGFLAFAAGVTAASSPVGAVTGRPAALAMAATALATAGVAATPLDAADAAHAGFVAVAYSTLTAMPLLAAARFRRQGRRRPAALSVLAGLVTGGALLASVVADGRTGLWQRLGLTTGDVWIVAASLAALRRADRLSR